MSELELLHSYLLIGGLMFATGMIGFLVRRNLIVMFLSTEIMLQGVSLSLVAWGRIHQDWGGQTLVVFIVAIAACEAAIGLALVLMLFLQSGSLDSVILAGPSRRGSNGLCGPKDSRRARGGPRLAEVDAGRRRTGTGRRKAASP
jgi:NADH:ubiquinone oxidoreductase subunit K